MKFGLKKMKWLNASCAVDFSHFFVANKMLKL